MPGLTRSEAVRLGAMAAPQAYGRLVGWRRMPGWRGWLPGGREGAMRRIPSRRAYFLRQLTPYLRRGEELVAGGEVLIATAGCEADRARLAANVEATARQVDFLRRLVTEAEVASDADWARLHPVSWRHQMVDWKARVLVVFREAWRA